MGGELLTVALGKSPRLPHPAAGVDRAPEHKRVEPGDVGDILQWEHDGIDVPVAEDASDLGGDLAGRSVLARCGDEHAHGFLLPSTPGWPPLRRRASVGPRNS